MISYYLTIPKTKKMELFWIISNLIILGFLILICFLGIFYQKISFGLELADLLGYIVLFGITLTHLTLTIYFWQNSISQYKYLAISFLIIAVFLSLQATIWRGNEYSWNGSIFYLPCPTKIIIKNQKEKKELLITMCSMQYNSSFTATWNGKEMENIKGEIKIPDPLKEYVNYPIKNILIQSYLNHTFEDKSSNGYSNFKKETLSVDKEYILLGEVIKIVDSKPMFKVKIKKS